MKVQVINTRVKTVVYFIIGILLIVLYEQSSIYSMVHRLSPLPVIATFYAIDIFYFFVSAYVLIPFSMTRPFLLLRIILAVFIALSLFILLQYMAVCLIGFCSTGNLNAGFDISFGLRRGIYLSLITIAYYLALTGVRRERQARLLEVHNLELQAANLRARIMPHFIFNTLQFFYSEADAVSHKMGTAVHLFSDVMHYTIDSQSSLTTLGEEITQVENYIAINRMRIGAQLQLILHVEADADTRQCLFAQMVLINLIENMFKHGQLLKAESPATIRIYGAKRNLWFHVSNRKGKAVKIPSAGVGMEYVRNHLEKYFSGKYSLIINDTSDQYDLKLQVSL